MDEAEEVLDIVARIKPLLAGRSPDCQGAVLCELLSIWIAGFPPYMRDDLTKMHFDQLGPLVELNAKIIRGEEPPA